MDNLQRHGVACYSVNAYGDHDHPARWLQPCSEDPHNCVGKAVRQWVLGSYLMGKGEAAAIALYQLGAPMGSSHGYGNWSYRSPEWGAEVGVALGPAVVSPTGVWSRQFSDAVALVNPWEARGTLSFEVPAVPVPALCWADLYGQSFEPGTQLELEPVTATTLVLVATAPRAAGGRAAGPTKRQAAALGEAGGDTDGAPAAAPLALALPRPGGAAAVASAASAAAAGVPSMAINPRYWAFSSYIGPIVNLTFADPAVMRVAATLGLGSLRYPGGSTTSHWNYTSGRWTDRTTGMYADRTRAYPRGTFTPDAYMRGLGGTLKVPPIWNLNLATLGPPSLNIADPPGQIDTLKRMRVPVEYLELDNEAADNPVAPYLASAARVVARAREVFPDAKISIIGCFRVDNYTDCMAQLRAQHRVGLFDAVTLHHYGPDSGVINQTSSDLYRRSATLAPALSDMRKRERMVATSISPSVPIWLDEFNWGGPWAGTMWPGEDHGGLRGLFWAGYVLAAIDVTARARAQGRAGYDAVMSYSLFHQNSSDWSKWASCAAVADAQGRADLVSFDGVAQVFAHFSRVALGSGYTDVVPVWSLANASVPDGVPGGAGEPCVVAARFFTRPRPDGTGTAPDPDPDPAAGNNTVVAINVCPSAVAVDFGGAAGAGTAGARAKGGARSSAVTVAVTYSGLDKGGFVLADSIGSLHAPPWRGGPLAPEVAAKAPASLPPVSLSFVTTTHAV